MANMEWYWQVAGQEPSRIDTLGNTLYDMIQWATDAHGAVRHTEETLEGNDVYAVVGGNSDGAVVYVRKIAARTP